MARAPKNKEIIAEATSLIEPEATTEDEQVDRALRPTRLADYVGQRTHTDNLKVLCKRRSNAASLWITSFVRPTGLGQDDARDDFGQRDGRDLARNERPRIEDKGTLAAQLTKLGRNDILFIDKGIHRLSAVVKRTCTPRWRTTSSMS